MVKSFLVMGLAALSWINAVPQSKTSSASRTRSVGISGTSFDEKHFVSDADMKFWNVANPNALKGHACEHITITGQVNDDTITVRSVKVAASTHAMPSNDDYQLNRLPNPFPDYLKREEIPTK